MRNYLIQLFCLTDSKEPQWSNCTSLLLHTDFKGRQHSLNLVNNSGNEEWTDKEDGLPK